MPNLTGECFCGKIKYRISGALHDARSCHCSRCRKAFSAQASAYARIEPDALVWTEGEAHLSTYLNADGTGKQFCSICGSMLCGILDGKVHGIALGCLDNDESVGRLTHIHVSSKAAWEEIPETALAYDTVPPDWQ